MSIIKKINRSKLLFLMTLLVGSNLAKIAVRAKGTDENNVESATHNNIKETTTASSSSKGNKIKNKIVGRIIASLVGSIAFAYILYRIIKKYMPSKNIKIDKHIWSKEELDKHIPTYEIGADPVKAVNDQINESDQAVLNESIDTIKTESNNEEFINKQNYTQAVSQISSIIKRNKKIKGKEVVDLYAHLIQQFDLMKDPATKPAAPSILLQKELDLVNALMGHKNPLTKDFLASLILTKYKFTFINPSVHFVELGELIGNFAKIAPYKCTKMIAALMHYEGSTDDYSNILARERVIYSLQFSRLNEIITQKGLLSWLTELLYKAMQDKVDHIQIAAIQAIAKVGIHNDSIRENIVKKILQEAEKQYGNEIKCTAIQALAFLKIKEVIPILMNHLHPLVYHPESTFVQESIKWALREFWKNNMLTENDIYNIGIFDNNLPYGHQGILKIDG